MECTRRSPLFRRYRCAQEHPSFYALTNLFPSISRYKRKMETRAKGGDFSDDPSSADISRTGAPRKLVFTPSPAPLPKAVTTFDGSHQGLRPFTAALLVHLGPLTAWILESAPAHLATLSAGKKKDVKAAEAEFRDAYGDVGVMIARQHILQILIRVFQELQPTAHLMRSEALYEYGRTAATDVWDAIFATYNAKSDFVCNQTMALLKLLQQFDGTNFLGMQADLNSLLTQIAVDKISIRDLAAMCLVVGIKNAGLREPLFRDAYHKIIQTKSTQYLQIMPAKTPGRLLTVLARTQDAFDILEATPNYEPHTARAYFTGTLGNVTGVKASGCGGCVQHCIGVKHDDNTKFWRATPTHKPRAGNRAHLAIEGPSDSFSSRYDGLEDIDKCVLACDRALNDTNLNPKIREDIRMAAHHGDHPRLAALFVQCERATELQADCAHAFMASRVSGPPPSPVSSAAASVDRYFPVDSAAADRERTRRDTDFYSSFD